MTANKSTQEKPSGRKFRSKGIFNSKGGAKLKKSSIKVKKNKKRSSDDLDLNKLKKISAHSQSATNQLFAQKNVKRESRVSYETMKKGTVVCCHVSGVSMDHISVSLPYMMTGIIPLTNISPQFTELMREAAKGKLPAEGIYTLPNIYYVGQYLLAAVDTEKPKNSQGEKRPLVLTLFPSAVNGNSVSAVALKIGDVIQGCVQSIEDHGFIINTGVRGVNTAFLPKKNVDEGEELKLGSTVFGVVKTKTGGEGSVALTLSVVTEEVTTALAKPQTGPGAVRPGCVVEGLISAITKTDLKLHLGTEEEYYEVLEDTESKNDWKVGVVDQAHLRSSSDGIHFFRTGTKLVASVLFVSEFPKTVYLTLNKKICQIKRKTEESAVLTLKESVNGIVSNVSDRGVFVKIDKKFNAFCFLHKATDRKNVTVSYVQEKFPIGKEVSCLPVAYNSVDNCYVTIFGEKIDLEATENVKIGDQMTVKILEYNQKGAVVLSESGVRGFVYNLHISEGPNPQTKCPVGSSFPGKVIKIKENSEGLVKKSIYFTLRTAMVENDVGLVTEYLKEHVGTRTSAPILSIHPRTLFLELAPFVRTAIYDSYLPEDVVLSATYKVGQVLDIQIIELSKSSDGATPLYVSTIFEGDREPTDAPWLAALKGVLSEPKKSKKSKTKSQEVRSKKSKGKSSNEVQKSDSDEVKGSKKRKSINSDDGEKKKKKKK